MLTNIEWQEGYVHSAKKDNDTYYLEYGGINVNTFENFFGYCYIRRAKEAALNKSGLLYLRIHLQPYMIQR